MHLKPKLRPRSATAQSPPPANVPLRRKQEPLARCGTQSSQVLETPPSHLHGGIASCLLDLSQDRPDTSARTDQYRVSKCIEAGSPTWTAMLVTLRRSALVLALSTAARDRSTPSTYPCELTGSAAKKPTFPPPLPTSSTHCGR
jgi:hypothetical protein